MDNFRRIIAQDDEKRGVFVGERFLQRAKLRGDEPADELVRPGGAGRPVEKRVREQIPSDEHAGGLDPLDRIDEFLVTARPPVEVRNKEASCHIVGMIECSAERLNPGIPPRGGEGRPFEASGVGGLV